MKRLSALLASGTLLLVFGCARDYDIRLEKTVENLRYQKRLNDNLEKPADTKSSVATANIYVRPPMGLKGPSKEIGLTVVEPGKYDVATTFFDDKGSLHLLARVEKPKAAPTKKGPTPPADAVPRGEFTADVLELLKNAYAVDEIPKIKSESKKNNTFKTVDLNLANKLVKVYFFGEKNSPAQVALIFDYPKDDFKNLSSKIDLCLESFRTGEAAKRLYSGQDEEGGEGTGTAPPTGVF